MIARLAAAAVACALGTAALAMSPEDVRSLDDPFGFVFGQLLDVQEHSITSTDALRDQLTSFLAACRGEHPPEVPGEHGLRAVRLAHRIQDAVQSYLEREAQRAGIRLPEGFKA